MVGGGIGASRLAVPLARRLGPGSLTLVVNTADDLWRYGLRICPDLDTNLYALAGWRDAERGWGLVGDTFRVMDRCRELGDDAWFNLGDLDLATHLLRTGWLGEGIPLHEVTRRLVDRAGVGVTILPMTNDEVATTVHTPNGPLRFQEFFVRERARPEVVAVDWDGIDRARPAPGVLEAVAGADLVVLGPSNPVASVLPALSLAG
jgi:LPPG:FO 2-phospho-L-lactate transferase